MAAPSPHVLVTGAGGFVGAAVALFLARSGWEVTGTYRRHLPRQIEGTPRLSLLRADLCEGTDLPSRFGMLVHCAAEIPAKCPDANALRAGNLEATRQVLKQAGAAGARRVVYLSSMAAYGRITADVVEEATPPDSPDAYGAAKAACETAVATWAEGPDRAAVSIRLPGVVGAGGSHNFLCDALRTLLADGVVRAFNPEARFNNVVRVDDLARFISRLPDTMPAGHTVLTMGAREPVTIRQVLERMFLAAGKSPRIEWGLRGHPFLISFRRATQLGYVAPTVLDAVDSFVIDTLAARGTRS